MKTKRLQAEIIEFSTERELNGQDAELVKFARKAVTTAYAPYSKFRVGAAVLLANGKIICGSNQENAAYPSGLCAERVAIFAAASSFPKIEIKAIAVSVDSGKNNSYNEPVAPCGACRQVMAEFELLSKKNIRILMSGKKGKVFLMNSVKELLPLMFGPESL